jgi:hypothetical protein
LGSDGSSLLGSLSLRLRGLKDGREVLPQQGGIYL